MSPQQKQIQASRTPKARTNVYPALQFETASWVFHFWAQSLLSGNATKERMEALTGKLERVMEAISEGISKGSQAYLPDEILRDEYNALEERIPSLVREMRSAKSSEGAENILISATLNYGVECSGQQSILAERPLILDQKRHVVEVLAAGVRNGCVSPGELRRNLAAQLFAYSPHSVKKKLQDAREGDRKLPVETEHTSAVQTFLVAAFVIGARKKMRESELLRILEALRDSGYRALGLYHLAKCISAELPETDVEFCWEPVKVVCDRLRKSACSTLVSETRGTSKRSPR